MEGARGTAIGLILVLFLAVLLAGMAPAATGVSVTVPYSATSVADSDLDGNPSTGAWSDAVSWAVPLENGAASPYGSATLYAKHDNANVYLRIDGHIDVPWTSASGNHFWIGMQWSTTGTSHHSGSGSWDGVFFGESGYAPAPSYPPIVVDTNGFSKPPAKDTTQNDVGRMGYSGTAAPFGFTAEWKRALSTGDSQDILFLADGTSTYNFFVTTDSDGGGSSGGAIDHSAVTNLNTMRFATPPSPTVHDVAVTAASAAPTSVIQGQTVTVSATVQNEGTVAETFDAKAYAGSLLVGTQNVANLAAGASKSLSFAWDTTGVTPAAYPIRVDATAVAGETHLADNTYTDGTVTVNGADAAPTVGSLSVSPAPAIPGQSVTFSVTASDADGDILTYTLSFGDGTSTTGSTAAGGGTISASHVYTADGQYTAVLTVDDGKGGTASTSGAVPVATSLLRVTTNPAVPGKILVDGIPRDEWGLAWMKIAPGSHTVSFGNVAGFLTPAAQAVTTTAGQTTTVQGIYIAMASLRVTTSPAVAGTISVDGIPRDDWGMWQTLPAGTYTISFGAVAGYDPPASQVVTLASGQSLSITGTYTANPSAKGPDPSTFGYLRVTTSPALDAKILVNGVSRDEWGLAWVKLAPGTYVVSFGDVYGYVTPAAESVTVVAGATATAVGTFAPLGSLRITTSPALAATVFVNNIPRDDWGMWQTLPAGTYTISFGPVQGYATPAPQTVTVTGGSQISATGTYSAIPVAAPSLAASPIVVGASLLAAPAAVTTRIR